MAGLNAFADFGAPPKGKTRADLPPLPGSGNMSKAQTMFQTLRRLHGHNLENKGLNDLSEAFQTFVTRTKFFSIGRLRRTWSHSAVEFMKYRRLLPMLVADESDPGSAFDDFDTSVMCFSARPSISSKSSDDKTIVLTNIPPRVTIAQLQSFFGKFGKIKVCKTPIDDKRKASYGTLPKKQTTKIQLVHITFNKEESAQAALSAPKEELMFYGQQMIIQPYVSLNRRKTVAGIKKESSSSHDDQMSRSSSALSISSSSTTNSNEKAIPLDDLPSNVLENIFVKLNVRDRIRLERISKRFLEISMTSWKYIEKLSFKNDEILVRLFNDSNNTLKNSHLKSILVRAGIHLKVLDLSEMVNLLNDKGIDDISHLCPNLEELDLSGLYASSESLRILGESLSNLRKLSYRDMKTMGDKPLWFLFKNCGKNIKYIDLRGCKRIKGRCFKLFGMLLEKVLLDGCLNIDNETIDDICLRSSNILVLKLNGCYKITDEAISTISRHLNELKEFSLSGDKFNLITTNGLMSLLRIDTLQSLEFDHNPLINNDFIEKIVDNLPFLKKLSIAYCGSDPTLTESSLMKLKEMKNLEEIDVSGIAGITNNVVIGISNMCSELNTVYLRSCIYLGDDGVDSLIDLKKLIHLDLSSCILITHKPIQNMVKAFKSGEGHHVTVIVGGTVCGPNQVRLRDTRVILDFNDYSGTSLTSFKEFMSSKESSSEPEDIEDDDNEFVLLEGHRSFVVGALNTEDDFPEGQDEKAIREWAKREAAELGLKIEE